MADSRPFSWLAKSCISDSCRQMPLSPSPSPSHRHHHHPPPIPSILSLPDDLLLDCFSRIPLPSLPSLSLACRRFALLLHTPSFHALRRSTGRLRRTLLSLSFPDPSLLTSLPLPLPIPLSPLFVHSIPISSSPGAFTHPRLAAIGRFVYVIGRGATLRYDSLTGNVGCRAPTVFPRRKFAAAVVGGRIYVSGGATRTSAVEEYDPEADEWRVVAEAPRRRYGCVGAAVGGVFYVVGGLRVGCRGEEEEEEGRGAHMCAGTMDGYHVGAGVWLRVRAKVPGGGCVVGACGVGARLF